MAYIAEHQSDAEAEYQQVLHRLKAVLKNVIK